MSQPYDPPNASPPQPPYSDPNYYAPPPKKDNTGLVIGLCIGCGCLAVMMAACGILIALLLPAVQAAREAARRMQCVNMEKQIGIALHNYHDVYGSLPPAYTTDEDGKPLHSWRVLLLPFVECAPLYGQIRLDEPWDSNHNRQFHASMPFCYACPSSPEAGTTGLTCYQWIIGPDTISDGPNAVQFGDVTRGLSNVVAVVEVIPSTCWMEPTDIPESELAKGINHSRTEGIGSRHAGGINACILDGSVRFLANNTDLGDYCRIRAPKP